MGSVVYRSKGFAVPKSKDYFVPIPRTLMPSRQETGGYSRRAQPISKARVSGS